MPLEFVDAIRQQGFHFDSSNFHYSFNMALLSHPGLGWLYVFSSFPPRPRPRPQKLFPLTSKPFELNLWYLARRIYGSGEMYWMTLTQGHSRGVDYQKCACLHDKVRTTHLITTNQGSFVALVMVITWLDFGEILLKIVILANFR